MFVTISYHKSVSVHPYAHPPQEMVLKPYICVKKWSRMQFEQFYSVKYTEFWHCWHTSITSRVSPNSSLKSGERFVTIRVWVCFHMSIHHRRRCSNTLNISRYGDGMQFETCYSLNHSHSVVALVADFHHLGFIQLSWIWGEFCNHKRVSVHP